VILNLYLSDTAVPRPDFGGFDRGFKKLVDNFADNLDEPLRRGLEICGSMRIKVRGSGSPT
jgi:hypothetical protein